MSGEATRPLKRRLAEVPAYRSVMLGVVIAVGTLVGFALGFVGSESLTPKTVVAGVFALVVSLWIAWADLYTHKAS